MADLPIDNEIKALFLNEINVQVPELKKCLLALNDNPKSFSQLELLMEIVQAIEQAASIIHFTILTDLSACIIKYSMEEIAANNGISKSRMQLLWLYYDHLESLAKTPLQDLDSAIEQKFASLVQIKNAMIKPEESRASQQEREQLPPIKVKSEALVHDPSMFELFKIELETQSQELNKGLLEWERENNPSLLESMMRAAHSIKGAARILGLDAIVKLAHIMEDRLVSVQSGKSVLGNEEIDSLLKGVDFLVRLSKVSYDNVGAWLEEQNTHIGNLVGLIQNPPSHFEKVLPKEQIKNIDEPIKEVMKEPSQKLPEFEKLVLPSKQPIRDRVLRVTAESLNRLMGLAGESVVESHWLDPFGESLQQIKTDQLVLSKKLDVIREKMILEKINPLLQEEINHLQVDLSDIRTHFSQRLDELENFIRRHTSLSDRLYQEVINSRMRPFADGIEAFPRMVRDLAKQLGKSVRFEIEGRTTQVDRDILEKIEAPLSHLLRNAIDHGIETPEERVRQGKPPEGFIQLEASHRAAVLTITVTDDGRGINFDALRHLLIDKSLLSPEIASRLGDSEIAEFLFLPGFTTAKEVTEISGRGVGLNVVKDVIQEVGGIVKIISEPGVGTKFLLQLPLTLSVIRTLIVSISGEPYAFPLSRVTHTCEIHKNQIETLDRQYYFYHENKAIGLIPAAYILDLKHTLEESEKYSAVIIGDHQNQYALIVDRLIGEKELVVHQLNRRLGHIIDVLAGAIIEDGSPVLILDVEDLIKSIEKLLVKPLPERIGIAKQTMKGSEQKSILVADDSITVREVISRLLKSEGFDVDSVGNGLDG